MALVGVPVARRPAFAIIPDGFHPRDAPPASPKTCRRATTRSSARRAACRPRDYQREVVSRSFAESSMDGWNLPDTTDHFPCSVQMLGRVDFPHHHLINNPRPSVQQATNLLEECGAVRLAWRRRISTRSLGSPESRYQASHFCQPTMPTVGVLHSLGIQRGNSGLSERNEREGRTRAMSWVGRKSETNQGCTESCANLDPPPTGSSTSPSLRVKSVCLALANVNPGNQRPAIRRAQTRSRASTNKLPDRCSLQGNVPQLWRSGRRAPAQPIAVH